MKNNSGMIRPEIDELPRITDRLSFVYLEKCNITREDSAILVRDVRGSVFIPAASISVLMLGPGTDITHRAIELIGDLGVTVIWVGENGVKYYAGGRPLTHKASLLMNQARLVCNQRDHLDVARAMFKMRFPGENVSSLTMQQLRGREGSRVRRIYKSLAKKYDIDWDRRNFDPDDFNSGNPINQALSVGNMCLYGLAHSVIFALGCSPGLGFVHIGHENSFVYDIADLYKADVVFPLAFEVGAENPADIASVMRHRTRDVIWDTHLLERMVRDIKTLLRADSETDESTDCVFLWDNTRDPVPSGLSWGSDLSK